MIVDTLPVLMDTLPVVADSVATEIATKIGTEVSALVSLGLGMLIKVLVDLGKKASVEFEKAPDMVKAFVALAFGQLAAFISVKTGIPISSDVAILDVTLAGAVVSAIAMGIHSGIKAIRQTKTEQPTT
jgi:hypothetical protein